MARDKMVSINKERLKYAREHYGLSLEDVNSMAVIKYQDLERFENGEAYPSYAQLSRLSELYNRPLLFFFFCDEPPNENISVAFRSIEREIGTEFNKQIRVLMEKAYIYKLNLTELYDKQLGKPYFQNMLVSDSIDNDSKLSVWLREKLDLPLYKQKKEFRRAEQLIEFIREKLYDIGIYVFKDSFGNDSISALCLYDDIYPIILLNNKTTFNRQLFSIFHEIYHLFNKKPNVYQNQKGAEKDCDKFAGEFLIPDEDLDKKELATEKCEDERLINSLADEYTVSREAMAYRLLSKGYISKEFYMSIKDNNIRKKNTESSGGNFYFTRISYLGKPYLKQVFTQYYNGKINTATVAKYTFLKAAHITRLSSFLFGGEF